MSPTEALRQVVRSWLVDDSGDAEKDNIRAQEITHRIVEALWDKGFEVRPVPKPNVQYVPYATGPFHY